MNLDQLIGRAFSASYAPTELEPRRDLEEALHDLHANHQRAGSVTMRYQTTLFLARKGKRNVAATLVRRLAV